MPQDRHSTRAQLWHCSAQPPHSRWSASQISGCTIDLGGGPVVNDTGDWNGAVVVYDP